MAIDVATEQLIGRKEYAEIQPPNPDGTRMAPSTFFRHWKYGIKGIKLEVVHFGGRVYTSPAAVQRFVDRLTAAARNTPATSPDSLPSAPTRSASSARRKAIDKAERELIAQGM